jgi:biopolymer transport protein ExbD
MAFRQSAGMEGKPPMAEINMIPLIDVMLVLLVVFMITAPLLSNAVKVELPKANSMANAEQGKDVRLSIQADGSVFWNAERVTRENLAQRMQDAAALTPLPGLYIHADAKTPYEVVAQVMALAAKSGMSKIGFVSDPLIGAQF